MLLGRPAPPGPAPARARPDVFVANSTHVAARIAKYYRRDARVVHPPVDVERHLGRAAPSRRTTTSCSGRVVPYKRVDLAVARLRRARPPGQGRRRRARAGGRRAPPPGPGAEFLGFVPDDELVELLAGARALLFPGEEDFGIVPVEAQAAGVPVIAYGVGGVRDSVVDGETGVLFAEQTVDVARGRDPSSSKGCDLDEDGDPRQRAPLRPRSASARR